MRGRLAALLGARWRWAVVAAVVALLVALPTVVRLAPVAVDVAGDTGAGGGPAALLARIQASAALPWSGYAESSGTLALPATGQLDDVSALLSGRTQVRAWWRSADDWRADTLTPAGERSTRTTSSGTLVWDYEDDRVVTSPPESAGTARLPRETDLLPPVLAARLLSETTAEELTPLAPRRVAGRSAVGLERRPGDPLSSIGRVDVWADAASGIPVHVEVFGRDGATAAVSSTFLDFSNAVPSASDLAFTTPPGARVRSAPRTDLVRDLARGGGPVPPATLLGLPRHTDGTRYAAIGEYGRGLTQLVVGAVPDRLAGSLRDALRLAAGAQERPEGLVVAVGPLGLLLTASRDGRAWLLAGTVTADGLAGAAGELTGAAA